MMFNLEMESRSDIPNSILKVKVWYDSTFMTHPDVKGDQTKAKELIRKAIEEMQKIYCHKTLGFQLNIEVSFKS